MGGGWWNVLETQLLKYFPTSSVNTTIIGATFSYVFSAFEGNFIRSSSNANSKPGFDDTILDQN